MPPSRASLSVPSATTAAAQSPERGLDVVWRSIDAFIDQQRDVMINLRRTIHANPEASGQEVQTTQLIAQQLRAAGLHPRIMRGDTGVIVDIDLAPGSVSPGSLTSEDVASGNPAPGIGVSTLRTGRDLQGSESLTASFVALRAELDCVKIEDDKAVPYASRTAGLCHACGHDAHATIVLGAALALHANCALLREANLHHNIRVIFQPAEETATGAVSMISQGAIEGVKAILAVHVEPFLDVGVIGMRKGPLTSSCKTFRISVKGRSGHSARPFQAIDPIPAAVSVTDLLYQLGPRSMDSRYPLALTVASINAGSSFNAIPDEAEIRGTLRTARLEDLEAVERRMHAIIEGVSRATGCEITIEFPVYAPATNNDPELIDIMAEAAQHTPVQQDAGIDAPTTAKVHWLEVPSLGAEDFAFFQEKIPGAIVRLGAGLPDQAQRRPLHNSLFDIDERVLAIGAKFLARAALLRAARD